MIYASGRITKITNKIANNPFRSLRTPLTRRRISLLVLQRPLRRLHLPAPVPPPSPAYTHLRTWIPPCLSCSARSCCSTFLRCASLTACLDLISCPSSSLAPSSMRASMSWGRQHREQHGVKWGRAKMCSITATARHPMFRLQVLLCRHMHLQPRALLHMRKHVLGGSAGSSGDRAQIYS